MKREVRTQLMLFGRKADRVAECPACHRVIVVEHCNADGSVISEYCGAGGKCFECTFKRLDRGKL